MKVISMEQAQAQFPAVCAEALAGEVIRLQIGDGALLELTAVRNVPSATRLSEEQLRQCYEDEQWPAFENHCAQASD